MYNEKFSLLSFEINIGFADCGFHICNLPVCRVAALETASISEYAKPYVEELTESIPFDYDDYTKPIKRDEFARLIYFAIKQMSDAMTTKVVLNDAAPPFSDTDDVFVVVQCRNYNG